MRDATVLKERDRLRVALLLDRSRLAHAADLGGWRNRSHRGRAAGCDDAVSVARMEVARLRRFLDNLVDMVRIDAGALELRPEPIDLVERDRRAARPEGPVPWQAHRSAGCRRTFRS